MVSSAGAEQDGAKQGGASFGGIGWRGKSGVLWDWAGNGWDECGRVGCHGMGESSSEWRFGLPCGGAEWSNDLKNGGGGGDNCFCLPHVWGSYLMFFKQNIDPSV